MPPEQPPALWEALGDTAWPWGMALPAVVGAELGAGTGWGALGSATTSCKVSGRCLVMIVVVSGPVLGRECSPHRLMLVESFVTPHLHLPCFTSRPPPQVLVLRLRDSIIKMGEELEKAAESEAREKESTRYYQRRMEEMKADMDELVQRELESSRRRVELVRGCCPRGLAQPRGGGFALRNLQVGPRVLEKSFCAWCFVSGDGAGPFAVSRSLRG